MMNCRADADAQSVLARSYLRFVFSIGLKCGANTARRGSVLAGTSRARVARRAFAPETKATMASLAEQREAAEQEAIALLREENALKRRRLDQERREIEALEQRNLANNRLVRLNVGGKHFDTFRETFDAEPGSYFDRFLGGQGTNELAPGVTDTDGRFVIDRDGELFGLLLRGLRGASLSDVSAAQRAELVEETIFYGMDRLMHRLLQGYDPYCLSRTDLELRLQAQAALRWLDGGGGGGENPELIDVLAHVQSFALAPGDERRLADPETPLLFENVLP